MGIDDSANDLGGTRLIDSHEDNVVRLAWNGRESCLDGRRATLIVSVVNDVPCIGAFYVWNNVLRHVAEDNNDLRRAALKKDGDLVLDQRGTPPMEKRLGSAHA